MAKLVYFDDDHRYELDGVVLPSVTHICRYLSVDIVANAKPWLRDAAADRGNRIHAYCADIDLDIDEGIYDPDCAGYVAAYKAFLRDYRPEWKLIETPIASATLGVAGTLDRLGRIDGKQTILDIKTGSTVEKAQIAAQCGGYHSILGAFDCTIQVELPEGYMGLKLRKDGTYIVYTFTPELQWLFIHLYAIDKERSIINARK